MSEQDSIRGLDAEVLQSLIDIDYGDEATYTDATHTDTPCHVLIDYDAVLGSGEGQPFEVKHRVTFQRAQVEPVTEGVVTIDGESFILEDKETEDPSLVTWIVVPE